MKPEYTNHLISVSAVGLWGFVSAAPEALKLLSLTIAVAAGHALVSWLQYQKQRWEKAREKLDRPSEVPSGEVRQSDSETPESGEHPRSDSEGKETHGVRS